MQVRTSAIARLASNAIPDRWPDQMLIRSITPVVIAVACESPSASTPLRLT
jgi:hypothetical protein